jgi:DNA-binding transcriptional regulator YiaG
MTFKEMREQSGMSRQEFAKYFGIPYRTIQSWELSDRKCPQYLLELMEYKLRNEGKIK